MSDEQPPAVRDAWLGPMAVYPEATGTVRIWYTEKGLSTLPRTSL